MIVCKALGCNKPLETGISRGSRGFCKAHYLRFKRHGDPLAGRPSWKTKSGEAQHWLEQHQDFDGTECLIWPFWRVWGTGHAMININGAKKRVSRLMCEHRHGPPPTPKHEAAHNCGKGHLGCVNGQHLDWKTHSENEADKLIHGTIIRGESHYRSKLTEANVLEIRASSISRQKLAQKYGVSQTHIDSIINRSRWAFLP